MDDNDEAFWSVPADELLKQLDASPEGLSGTDATARLKRYGSNLLKPSMRRSTFDLLFSQFKSPIILILICAATLALFLKDQTDAIIILVIVLFSGLLGFWQERGAHNAVQRLLAIVQVTAGVLRDEARVEIPVEDVVPGDIVMLDAGDIIPGDSRLLDAKDLFVDEASLTGETFPVENEVGVLPADTPLAKRTNVLFMGTHVISGTAKALVVRTGKSTEFGKVSEHLKGKAEETEFERGVKRFGYLLMEVTLVLVVAIFAINVLLHKPPLQSFLFSLALAVGLTPQLLPAIISINLAKGAKRMADEKVIVKRLASIENFGSMDVLCCDKTGTLTEGEVRIDSALDVKGGTSDRVWLYAYLNAAFETGFTNPIDEAVRKQRQFDIAGYQKIDEVPYDFIRKRLSVAVTRDGHRLLITKGAVDNVLAVCAKAELPDGSVVDVAGLRDEIVRRYDELGGNGFRTLGVAYCELGEQEVIKAEDEHDMTFLGMLALFDPPKQDAAHTIEELAVLGVKLIVITGDNHLVARHVACAVGLPCESADSVITGSRLDSFSDEALQQRARQADVYAEVEPNQKERIIRALQHAGEVVGYMGDGINDASALHAADVGISVDSAVDVAKEAADFVLLEKDLGVLQNGVREGRVTFANTLKYVFMATSANFGNMFSMAGASLFLKFLPLLPGQVLMTNLFTDFPEMTIATDSVDKELVDKPHRWDIHFIRRFMLTFGLLSSVFDYATFAVLLWVLHANQVQFHTGWFVESVVSASVIVLVIRTRRVFFRSRPGKYLMIATALIVAVTVTLPFTPLAKTLGFTPLPWYFFALLAAIVVVYVASAEVTKRVFYHYTSF